MVAGDSIGLPLDADGRAWRVGDTAYGKDGSASTVAALVLHDGGLGGERWSLMLAGDTAVCNPGAFRHEPETLADVLADVCGTFSLGRTATAEDLMGMYGERIERAVPCMCRNVSNRPQYFQCSECSKRGIVTRYFENGTRFNYCPNCGRRVEVDQ